MNNITLKPKEGVELLAIVVDKDAYDFRFNEDDFGKIIVFITNNYIHSIDIPKEKYSTLGCVEYNKPIGFDCEKLVDRQKELVFENTILVTTEDWYKNYLTDKYDFCDENDYKLTKNKSYEKSFISLLEANNINLKKIDKENKKLVILIKQ